MLDAMIALSCRTCMKNDVNLVNLNEPVKIDDGSHLQLFQLLMECTTIQVTEEDGLPYSICDECSKVLFTCFAFRQQAAKSEEKFKELKEQVKQEIKAETDEDFFDTISNSIDLPDVTDDLKVDVTDDWKVDITDDLKVHVANDLKEELTEDVFNCSKCSKVFTKEKKYLKHIESHNCSFHCPDCKKTFTKEASLKKHAVLCKYAGFSVSSDSQPQDLYTILIIKNENGEEEQRYQCRQCELSYCKLRNVLSHVKKHKHALMGDSFVCDSCGKSCATKQLLKRHMKTHYDQKRYQCTQCKKAYSRKDQLRAHMITHKEYKPNVCPHCSKAFAQVCSLKDHIRTHTKETPYLCSECGKGFGNGSNLRQHMLRHTGVKNHKCKLCPKTFCTKGQMTSHMATHTGAHPYKCDKCGAAFTKSNSLKKHAMIHSGQRPFACDTCLMRFTCKDHLKRHYRIHTGEKPYKCKLCERAFTQSNDLAKHMRSHLGQNIYNCSVCGAGFRLQSELKQHYPVHFIEYDPSNKTQRNETHSLWEVDGTNKANIPSRHLPSDICNMDIHDNIMQEKINIQGGRIQDIHGDKFMITINSVDNMVAINIEPENSTVKV